MSDAADLPDVVADLAGVDLLADVSATDLAGLAAMLFRVAAPEGEVLILRGTAAEGFLLVTAGTVAVEIGEGSARRRLPVQAGSILGEIALLRGEPHGATATAVSEVRGLVGGTDAFERMLALPGVRNRTVTRARQRLAAGLSPVPVPLADGTVVRLRPVLPDDGRRLLQARSIVSLETVYRRFFSVNQPTPETARMLTDIDYVDHFAWVAVDEDAGAVGGVSYVRSTTDRTEADISFSIMDTHQGRGLGTVFMGAIAVAARRNGVSRFTADVLAENLPMRAILSHAGVRWEPEESGIVHGVLEVPDPARLGVDPATVADLADLVEEVCLRGSQSPLVVPETESPDEPPSDRR